MVSTVGNRQSWQYVNTAYENKGRKYVFVLNKTEIVFLKICLQTAGNLNPEMGGVICSLTFYETPSPEIVVEISISDCLIWFTIYMLSLPFDIVLMCITSQTFILHNKHAENAPKVYTPSISIAFHIENSFVLTNRADDTNELKDSSFAK